MEIAIGFVIALAVGLTGIGGGSFTTPVLVLAVGLPAGEAVGTALVFSAIIRLFAAPFYLWRRQVHSGYLGLLLLGAIPGLIGGTYLLSRLSADAWSPVVLAIVGVMLTVSSALTFAPKLRFPGFANSNSRFLPWLALPIGVETGFSSAGAGALGTILLLNYSELAPAAAVGTDLLFGLVMAILGGAFHLTVGTLSGIVLMKLLAGGVPGVLLGSALSRQFPSHRLRAVVAMIALILGLQLVWNGTHQLLDKHSPNAKRTIQAPVDSGRQSIQPNVKSSGLNGSVPLQVTTEASESTPPALRSCCC